MRELAYWLYLAFTVSWFLHLPARVPALAPLRLDLLLVLVIAGLALAGGAATPTGRRSRIGTLVTVLIVYAAVTAPFVEWPGSVVRNGLPTFFKAAVFYFFTAALVTSERKLKQLLFVFVLCQTFRVLEPLYLHVADGYWGSAASMADWEMLDRLSGAPSDVINPNGLAFVILTAIPFLHYLWTTTWIGGLAYLALLPALLYALVLTGSRSGMVGLAVTFAAFWVQSSRKVLLTAVLALGVVFALPRLSPDQLDRYRSIVSTDTKNAATAAGRLEGMRADFLIAMRRPLFGHGLGTSAEANFNFGGRAQPSHNLITEVLQELGLAGLVIFLVLVLSIINHVRRALQLFRATPRTSVFVGRVCQALQVWVVMNVIFSLFSYGLSSFEWYFMAGLATVLSHLMTPVAALVDPGASRASEKAPEPASSGAPVRIARAHGFPGAILQLSSPGRVFEA